MPAEQLSWGVLVTSVCPSRLAATVAISSRCLNVPAFSTLGSTPGLRCRCVCGILSGMGDEVAMMVLKSDVTLNS